MTDHADPKREKCGAPVTTGLMPMFCPHARQCEFVSDDDHWAIIEEFRSDMGIERVQVDTAAEAVARAVIGGNKG